MKNKSGQLKEAREMNRPTPETDAARHDFSEYGPPVPCSYGDWVPFEVTERLERERDEAREEVKLWQRERDEAITRRMETIMQCELYEQERDEAREALAATKHYLTKERDDALSQIVQTECRAERFCQERDEARESLENARELNKWLTVFLEHIRDNADIRYGKHRGLLAFSDLREEASRKWKEATK